MINLKKHNIKLLIDFDSTFIKTESLEIISQISLKESPNKENIINEIKQLTYLAMNGKISFAKALTSRIKLLRANQSHIDSTIEKIKTQISNSFKNNLDFFKKNCDNCYIVSGGFTQIIEPIVKEFNINVNNIYANDLIFNKKKEVISINKDNPLSKDLGKISIAKNINGIKIAIGDGYTDYEIKKHGFSNHFIQYTENINREELNEFADLISKDLNQVLNYISKLYKYE